MKSKKIIAAVLAIAMMVTSVQLPPVQVSAEEITVQSTNDKEIPVSVLSAEVVNCHSGQDGNKVLDNDYTSKWHTKWNGDSGYEDNYNHHYIDFELTEDYIVSGLRYWPSQDEGSINGIITQYKIFVSDDKIDWEQVKEGNWEWTDNKDRAYKEVNFVGQQTKYVRLKSDNAKSDNDKKFTAAAEIRLLGRQPEPEGAMSAISVKTAPRTVYSVGETFDPTGLVLNLIYEDGQTRELAYSDKAAIEFNVTDELTLENAAVKITYGGFNTTLPIKVMNVEIQEPPTELTPEDDSRDYDVSKMIVSADSTRINFEPENVKDGTQDTFWQADWSVADKKLEFTVELEEATRLEALRYLPKFKDEDGGTNGFIKEYRVDYSMDGSEWFKISSGEWTFTNEYKIAAFDEAVTAKYVRLTAIKVLVRGQESTAEMAIAELRLRKAAEDAEPVEKTLEAIHINEAPNTLYTVGEEFDPTGLKLTCVYSDGSRKVLEYSEGAGITFSVPDVFTKKGTETVTVTYQEKTTTLDVVVQPVPVLTGIIVYKEPKTIYAEDETFDPAGLKVQLVYDNKAKVVDTYAANPLVFAFAPNRPLEIGDNNVTITYTVDDKSFTAALPIEVKNSAAFAEYQTQKEELDRLKTALNEVLADANALLTQKNEQMKIAGAELEVAQTEAFEELQTAVNAHSNVGEVQEVTEKSSLTEINSAKAAIASAKAEVENETTVINTAITNLRNIYVDEASLLGYNLVLEGTIDFNFIMQLDSEKVDELIAEKAYMKFTLGGQNVSEVNVSKELLDPKGSGNYIFKYGVPAKDMDKKIEAQLIVPDAEGNEVRKGFKYTYSVNDYIKYSVNSGEEEHVKARDLVKAMSNFGDYATAYFDDKKVITDVTEEFSVSIREELDSAMDSAKDNLKKELAENYMDSIPKQDEVYYGSSLLLKSDTVLRHYFREKVSVNGQVATQKENLYFIEHTGIAANKLGEDIEMIVTRADGLEYKTITYSPLTYAYLVLELQPDSELEDLMRAMYLYHQAAQEYLSQ